MRASCAGINHEVMHRVSKNSKITGCLVYINAYFCLCTYLDHTQQSQNLMPRDQPEEERINAKYVENGRQK